MKPWFKNTKRKKVGRGEKKGERKEVEEKDSNQLEDERLCE